jgi:membrane protein DedA with SNARE-associated domain
LTQHLILLVTQYGLLIVGVNVLLNQIGLPVPAVPILVVAGAIGAGGNLALGPIFGWSVAACVAADCGWFLIGERYGISVLKILCRISLEPDSCVSQTQTRFEQWGINSLVIAKFVPGLSIIAPPLAGALRIGWLRFIVLSTLGAILWAGGWLAVGVLFESQIDALLGQLDRIGGIAGLIAAGLLAAYIAFKWWERMRFFQTLRMARIRVEDLYELIQAGAAPIIIDVRSVTARALEPRSIPGALHVPLQEAGRHLQDLPRDRDIILYCT